MTLSERVFCVECVRVMDRLTEMEAFISVVEQGGFTGAAKKLGVSKSAVSKHVSALEGRLGVRLLERTTRRVSITDLGRVYYDQSRQVLGAVREADQLVAPQSFEPEGLLRVALMDEVSARVVEPYIAGFLAQHPAVSLKLEPTAEYVELRSSGYDLAIRTGQSGDGVLMTQPLTEIDMRLVATPAYLNSAGVAQRIDDLAEHCLLYGLASAGDTGLALDSRAGEQRKINAVGRLVTRDSSTLLQGIRAGLGIGYVPEFMVRTDLAKGRLKDAMPALPRQAATVFAAYPPGADRSPKVAAFVSYMVRESKPHAIDEAC